MKTKPGDIKKVKNTRIKHSLVRNTIFVKPQWRADSRDEWEDFVICGNTIKIKVAMSKFRGNNIPVLTNKKIKRAESNIKSWLKQWGLPKVGAGILVERPKENKRVVRDSIDDKPKIEDLKEIDKPKEPDLEEKDEKEAPSFDFEADYLR